jgi:hypothetical protein
MSIPLKARRSFVYAGHRLKAGQDFDASGNSDANLLKAIGHAEDRRAAPTPDWKPPAQYKTRIMTSEQPAKVSQNPPLITKVNADLGSMDIDELRALADSLGIYVHHRAGAWRVRQAIIDYRQSKE